MKRSLLVALVGLVILAAGCIGGVLSGKATWLDYDVKKSECMSSPCVVVDAVVHNTGKGDLVFGSYVAYAYDASMKEIGRNSSWSFAVVKPGNTDKLHIAIPGVDIEDVHMVRLLLVKTSTDSHNEANQYKEWELRIPVQSG